MQRPLLNIIKVWYHEVRTVFRDKGILIFILFVPLFYPLLYSYVYTNELVREVPAVVVDDCQSDFSRLFVRNLDATQEIKIMGHSNSMAEAKLLMKKGEIYGVIRIPRSFDDDIWHMRQTYVGLYCSMSSMLYYKSLLLGCNNVALDMNKDIKVEKYLGQSTPRAEEISKMPIDYNYVPMFNPKEGFAAFLIPPVLMLILQQTLFLGIGMSMGDCRERYNGSVIPWHSAYKNPVTIVLGKSLLYFALYFILGIYMFVYVNNIFSLPRLGNYTTFMAFLVPYLLATIFLGMVLSYFVFRREDCIMIFVFLSVPMLFLSGISWPGAKMPEFWKYFSYLFPSTFAMNGYPRIATMGCTLQDVAPMYKAMWIQTGIYFLLACLLYQLSIWKLVRRYKVESE